LLWWYRPTLASRIGHLGASTSISEMLDKGRPEQILPSDATWPPYPSTLPTAVCFQTQQQKLISFLVALMFARRSRSLLPHRLAPPPGCLRSSPAGCGWLARPARRRPQSAGPAPYRPSYSEPRAASRDGWRGGVRRNGGELHGAAAGDGGGHDASVIMECRGRRQAKELDGTCCNSMFQVFEMF
jgi:hypothetical protein